MKTITRTDNSKMANVSTRPITVGMIFLETAARTESRVMRDATTLVEEGFAVTIVDVEKERTRPAEENIRGVDFKHIFMRSWFTPSRFKPWFLVKLAQIFVFSIFQVLKTPADIYHAHNERALLGAYIAARLRRKPLIFDAPELTLTEPNITRWLRLNALATRVIAGMLPYCAGVIVTSPLHAQELRNSFHIQEATLVRNVPSYRTVTKSDRIRQQLGLGPNVRIALYQGNLQPNRGLHVLVRAAPYLEKNIVIVMMGKGRGETTSQLNSLITGLGVAERVKIIPPAPYEELLEWTASADIGLTVYPLNYSLNVQTSLPNKFFEYLMAGLPILSSELDAMAELIRNYHVGRVVSSIEPAKLGAEMNAMLADTEALAYMSHNALDVCQREFHWEKERQQLIGLYHSILDVKPM